MAPYNENNFKAGTKIAVVNTSSNLFCIELIEEHTHPWFLTTDNNPANVRLFDSKLQALAFASIKGWIVHEHRTN